MQKLEYFTPQLSALGSLRELTADNNGSSAKSGPKKDGRQKRQRRTGDTNGGNGGNGGGG